VKCVKEKSGKKGVSEWERKGEKKRERKKKGKKVCGKRERREKKK
jgi:hypothetical protein